LNAAGALIVAGKVADLKEGVAMGAAMIDDGGARKVLQNLIDVTNQRPPM
jgi:anthranilate phosphoribosyltransferase